MLHLVILLLASGCVTLCSHVQDYYLITKAKKWKAAQSYCREAYTDLATIDSLDEMKRLAKLASARGMRKQIWIGLTNNGVATWMWSTTETQTSYGLAQYTNWATFPDPSHNCGYMGVDGKWFSALCKAQLPFVCQSDEHASGIYVVPTKMSWRKAQTYCRKHSKDLASVRSQTENQAVQQKISNQVPRLAYFWIGLFSDKWKWSDQSDSSIRYWEASQPNKDGNCALYNPINKAWYDRGCMYLFPFFCYKVKKSMRQIVRVKIKSKFFLTFSDSTMSEAILNHIKKKNEDAKLQWRVLPNGKIFDKQINDKA